VNEYLLAFTVIFAINLLPAFGPPTWSVLVLFVLNSDLAPLPLVVGGAVAAAAGRFVLATSARHLRSHLSETRREGLAAAREMLSADRRWALAGLALFAVSPLPSAQLFIAAGLLEVRLVPLTVAFFAGRLVSYSLYVGAAATAEANLGAVVKDSLTSPVGVALQVAMLAGIVFMVRYDWAGMLARRAARRRESSPAASADGQVTHPDEDPRRPTAA
jgi:membrane protein YqaA with SNARE-associated domain